MVTHSVYHEKHIHSLHLYAFPLLRTGYEKRLEAFGNDSDLAGISTHGLCACDRAVKSFTVLYSSFVNGNPQHRKTNRRRLFNTGDRFVEPLESVLILACTPDLRI